MFQAILCPWKIQAAVYCSHFNPDSGHFQCWTGGALTGHIQHFTILLIEHLGSLSTLPTLPAHPVDSTGIPAFQGVPFFILG